MSYAALKEFLEIKMRMSHIYQPVMIKHLLLKEGHCSDTSIAEQLLQYDPSQIEYYESITNKMVGKVLRYHDIVERNKKDYQLNGFRKLNTAEIESLIKICEAKIEEYIQKRGDKIWQHRKINRNAIPGTVRYEVLKRAQFRCELCGISAEERALEVDHINPKIKGGKDAFYNYQALCYVCNASKRDRDDTDLRDQAAKYAHREANCLFCHHSDHIIEAENNLAYVIRDKCSVTEGHCLIIPKRHFADYFSITQAEMNSVQMLLHDTRKKMAGDLTISGFNIGVNCGESAGQTIFHCHLHLIPRRKNDPNTMRESVRNITGEHGDY